MRLIDADALIVEIKNCLWDWESVNGITAKTVLKQAITDIGNMPTIDPVKHGRWENGRCNKCGFQTRVHPYHIDTNTFERKLVFKYCPNCGAKMDGGEG